MFWGDRSMEPKDESTSKSVIRIFKEEFGVGL